WCWPATSGRASASSRWPSAAPAASTAASRAPSTAPASCRAGDPPCRCGTVIWGASEGGGLVTVPSVRPLNPKVAALGGGHGLFAALSAPPRVTRQLRALVTVGDDG